MDNIEPIDAAQFKTVGDFLDWAAQYFVRHDLYYGHGTDNEWDEAVMLVLYELQLPAENDVSLLQRELTHEQQQHLLNLAIRRVTEKLPVPYLTNEAWFAGERYYVNQNVLIPRSPLAETILQHFKPWLTIGDPKNILDMCTGSGCLAILVAKTFPTAHIDAVDVSPAALEVAAVNVKLHHCADRVRLVKSDLFSALQHKKYDVIISNPPYVAAEEMQALPLEYKHEPELALASGVHGLDLTIKILQQAADYLTDDGILIVEVGNSWHALQELYPQIPFTWLDFEHGGEGVFYLPAKDLRNSKL